MNRRNILALLIFIPLVSFVQKENTHEIFKKPKDNKMKVEIWSDVVCPFCYIGKRKFEAALTQFLHRNEIEIVWKSYQLSPDMKTDPGKNGIQSLAEEKEISLERATGMCASVSQWAREVGLVYNFDKSIAANTFNAHRFLHFAKQYSKQSEAEEVLFRSYFTDGRNIDDYPTLIMMGAEIGLDTTALRDALESGKYAEAVKADREQARQVGVNGVPFFVFNGKYAVSGAQETRLFLKTMEKAFDEWQKKK